MQPRGLAGLGRRASSWLRRRSAAAFRRIIRMDGVAVVRVVVCGLLAWVAVGMVVVPAWPGTPISPERTSHWVGLLVLVLLAAAAAALPAAARLARRAGAAVDLLAPARRRALAVGAGAALLAGQLVLLAATAKTPGFDPGTMITAAWNRAHPGNGLGFGVQDGSPYYGILPNNLVLGWAEWGLFSLLAQVGLGSYPIALASILVVNAVALTASALLTVSLARRLLGTPAALMAVPGLVLFLGISPYINTPYSDTLGMLVVLVGWTVAVRIAESPRLLLWAAMAVVLGVGFAIKVTTVLLLAPAAVAAVLVVHASRPAVRRRRSVLQVGATAAAAAIVYNGLLAAVDVSGFVRFDVFANPSAVPFTHLMLMGVRGDGGFDYPTLLRTLSIASPTERFVYDGQQWLATVVGFGPDGYLGFLARKLFWMLGDGSFYQGWEGDPFPTYLLQGRPWSTVRQVWALDGSAHWILASAWQAGWLACLAGAGAALVVGDRRAGRSWTTAMRVGVLLLLLFLLLSEGRSRYVYIALPLVIALASAGGLRVADALRLRSRRARGRQDPAVGSAPPQETAR